MNWHDRRAIGAGILQKCRMLALFVYYYFLVHINFSFLNAVYLAALAGQYDWNYCMSLKLNVRFESGACLCQGFGVPWRMGFQVLFCLPFEMPPFFH